MCSIASCACLFERSWLLEKVAFETLVVMTTAIAAMRMSKAASAITASIIICPL